MPCCICGSAELPLAAIGDGDQEICKTCFDANQERNRFSDVTKLLRAHFPHHSIVILEISMPEQSCAICKDSGHDN